MLYGVQQTMNMTTITTVILRVWIFALYKLAEFDLRSFGPEKVGRKD